MTEAERLQKLVIGQEREIRRLRKLLEKVRIANVTYAAEGNTLTIYLLAVGVDELYFTEQCKPELSKIADALIKGARITEDPITDGVTGDVIVGGIAEGR